MSMPTLTLIATPDPDEPFRAQAVTRIEQLHDRLETAHMEYDALIDAARATLAADARNMSNPLGFLRDHLALIGALPEPGARPTDFQPTGPDGGVWGRR
ncbi:MAG TPA: hypothetical protein VGX23_14240 [Actinocrinis sp.]|nr:hypothetical protein [Actinocrinis sp.]